MSDELDDLLNQARQVGVSSDDAEESGGGWWNGFKKLHDTADTEFLPDYESTPFGKGAKFLEDKGWGKTAKALRSVTKPQHWAAEQTIGSPLRAASTAGSIATMGGSSALGQLAVRAPKIAKALSWGTRAVDAAGGVRGVQDAVELGKAGNVGEATVAAGAGALGFLGAGANPLAKRTPTSPLPVESAIPSPLAVMPKLPKAGKGKLNPANPASAGVVNSQPNLTPNLNPNAMPYGPAGMGRMGTAVNPVARKRQLIPELQKASPDDAFKWWTNHRETARAAGTLKAKEFTKYDGVTFVDYQKNPQAVAPELHDYFKLKHAELQNAGVKLGEKENYLPQLWENPDFVNTLSKDERRRLSLKPGFSFEAMIDNYEEGIAAGLKPKFKNLSELANHYESSASKAIADRQFFDYLKENKLIKRAGDAGTKGWKAGGWKEIDFDFFPQARLTRPQGQSELTRWIISPQALGGKEMFTGKPRHLTDSIQNYLSEPNKFLDHAATIASVPKNVVLSGGIPKTGINFHGWNTLVRKTFQAEDKSGEFLSGAWDLVNPKRAEARLATLETDMLDARRHGLVATAEGMNPDKYLAKAVQDLGPYAKFEGALDNLFAVPLFGKILPAWKLEMYDKLAKGFVQPGMTPLQIASAKREAAKQTNDFYGGINWKELGESKNMQNALRATLLAPDWLRSNYRMGKGTVEALKNPKDPKGAAYRKAMGTLMGAFVSANLANRVVAGRWTWENDPGHEFDVAIGEDDKGRIMYARPFGTAADFARIPVQIARSIAEGKPGDVGQVVLNRSSIPARQAWDWTAGDYRGDSLFTDRYNNPKDMKEVGATLGEDALGLTPGFVQAPINYGMGNISGTQAVAKSVEAPMGFAFPKDSKPPSKRKKKKGSVSFK